MSRLRTTFAAKRIYTHRIRLSRETPPLGIPSEKYETFWHLVSETGETDRACPRNICTIGRKIEVSRGTAPRQRDAKTEWRRGWDSNPRLSFPNTRFPSVLLKPLGHLSVFIAIRLAQSQYSSEMLLPRDLNLSGELIADFQKQLNAAVKSCGSELIVARPE
jgi:hypothetical protein